MNRNFDIQITANGNTLFVDGAPTELYWEELPVIKLILFQKKGLVRDVFPQMLVDRLRLEKKFDYLHLTEEDYATIKQKIIQYLDGK